MKPDWATADGAIRLFNRDCLDVLPHVQADCVVTDPPYGVGFQYGEYVDTEDAFRQTVVPAVRLCVERFPSVVLTMSMRRLWEMPPAKWALCWAKPGSVRRNSVGGFSEWEPVLVYGRCRFVNDFRYLPDCVNHADGAIEHPCPKPLRLFTWLVEGASDEGDTVCDPFLGSGTTACACIRMGRKFVGCETDAGYFREAVKRIEKELARFPLLEPPPAIQRELIVSGADNHPLPETRP